MSNIKEGAEIIGSPAIPIKNFYRSSVIFRKLPEMYKQLSQLEKEIETLREERDNIKSK
jgi:UDP-3-O-[3-hydroxymyristoyl] glucosamine N-acyltransferase